MVKTTFSNGHALLIGVGADLPVTVKDATALRDVLVDPTRAAYPLEQVELLAEVKATRKGILEAFDRLIEQVNQNPDATAIVYFSGHGGRIESLNGPPEYFLVPYGFNWNQRVETAISGLEFTEKIEAIKARKLVVLLDCCHAGGVPVLKEPGVTFTKSPVPPTLLSMLDSGSGRVVVASSHEGESSYTGTPYSVFTACLLEALQGRASVNKDSYARILDVLSYLFDRVPKRAPGPQKPFVKQVLDLGDNFPLCYYAGGEEKFRGEVPTAEPVRLPSRVIASQPRVSVFKQSQLNRLKQDYSSLETRRKELAKKLHELESDRDWVAGATNRLELERQIERDKNRLKNYDEQIDKLEQTIDITEKNIDKNKRQKISEYRYKSDFLVDAQQEQYDKIFSENNQEYSTEYDSEFSVLTEELNKFKLCKNTTNKQDITTENVQANLVFQENEPLENTLLYTATFFPELSPHDFERVISFLLEDRPLAVRVKSPITTEECETKILEIQEEKQLIKIWKNNLYQRDQFLVKCHLRAVRLEDSSQVIDFSLPHLRRELKKYLEEQQTFYLKEQFKRTRLLLFDSSLSVAKNAIDLSINMARSSPKIYGEDWLLEIVVVFTNQANSDIDTNLDSAQQLQRVLLEIEAKKRNNFVFTRISALVYQMLENFQLQDGVKSFLDRLMSAQFYEAVLAIVKHLRSVPQFNGIYWVKQLLDRGKGEIRSEAYKLLYSWLKQSGYRIYDLLEVLKTWLPESSRSPKSYSPSNEYALQLFVEYCQDTTSNLDPKYYGYWPSKYPLFSPLRGSSVDDKLETLVSWLFHLDIEGKLALRHIVDEGINATQLIGFLIAQWFIILCGLENKEHNQEVFEVFNKLLHKIIVAIDRSLQKELVQSWSYFTEHLLIEAEDYGKAGKNKLRKQCFRKRNLVKQLSKQFRDLQKNA